MSELVKKGASIKSVENALAVLEVFGETDGDVRLGHLSQKLNINKSSLFRILSTFVQRGYVEQIKKDGKYRLSVSAFEVGQKFLSRMELLRKAKPIMVGLARECDETVYLAVLAGREILLLDKVDTTNPVRIMPLVGKRYSLSQCAAGKVMQAYNCPERGCFSAEKPAFSEESPDAIRQRGFVSDVDSLGDGIGCLAVPVLNARKQAFGCLCIVAPQYRFTEEKVQGYLLPRLMVAGQTVSSQLGYRGHHMP